MNADLNRTERIKALCDEALDLDATRRVAFLERACAGDSDLRREVESLISHENSGVEFMARPAWQHVVADIARNREPTLEGRRLGQYQIHELLGEGGMGEVWRATDQRLKRDVAIKILPLTFSADLERIRRFEREAHTVSALKHPNIITIHEIGQADDLRYIVTELAEGRTLRDYLANSKPGWREAVRVAAQIAGALNAAHTAGIIHRDIKPENIILQPGGQVKVLDFGIAKSVAALTPDGALDLPDDGVQTRLGATPGTLKYMSPEQARGQSLDARTDIFSLGLVLFEMIAGQHPYAEMNENDVFEALKSKDEILPPGTDRQIIPSALFRILLRALRKNRDERYSSTSEMLTDLSDLKSLVEASRQEKGQKLFRARNANEMLTQFAVLYDNDKSTCIPLAALWTIWRFADLRRGKLERETIRKSLLSGLVRVGALALVIAAVTMAVAAALSVTEIWEEKVMRDGHTAAVRQVAFSPDGRLLVSVGEDAKVFVWDFARRERIAVLGDHTDWITSIAFSPDGKSFATGSHDRRVIVWDAARLEKVVVLDANQDKVSAVAFSPDGRLLAATTFARQTALWDTTRWEKSRDVRLNTEWGNLHFSPDSRWLLHSYGTVVDLGTGIKSEDETVFGVWAAISPDFKRRVTTDGPGTVKFFALSRPAGPRQWKLIGRYPRAHRFHGRGVAFSPDGKLVATSADDIILWDAATQTKITRLSHTAEVWWLTFSPDGRWLISTHADGAILLWDVAEREAVANFNEHQSSVRAVAFSRDGKLVASASEDRSILIWNADTAKKEAVLLGHETRVTAVRFSPRARHVASCDQSGFIKLWDLESHSRINLVTDFSCYDVAISTDGRYIAASSGVYDSRDGRQVMDLRESLGRTYAVDFSADGRRLAIATERGNVVLIDTEKWEIADRKQLEGSAFTAMRFSSDGKWLATGETDGSVKLFATKPLQPVAIVGRHGARVKSVAFSRDGSEIISASEDQTIALWDSRSRRLMTRIGTHAAPVLSVDFSPDGRRVISGEHDHSVRLYERHRTLWGFRLD